jgi:hypothetical protein
MRRKLNGPYIVAVLFAILSMVELYRQGYQDIDWIRQLCFAAAFVCIGSMPEAIRNSFRGSLRHPLGIAAFVLLFVIAVLIIVDLVR